MFGIFILYKIVRYFIEIFCVFQNVIKKGSEDDIKKGNIHYLYDELAPYHFYLKKFIKDRFAIDIRVVDFYLQMLFFAFCIFLGIYYFNISEILKAKSVFTFLIVLTGMNVFFVGNDRYYKNDSRIEDSHKRCENLFNYDLKSNRQLELMERLLENERQERNEASNQSFDFYKWWIPEMIGLVSAVYCIWFGIPFINI